MGRLARLAESNFLQHSHPELRQPSVPFDFTLPRAPCRQLPVLFSLRYGTMAVFAVEANKELIAPEPNVVAVGNVPCAPPDTFAPRGELTGEGGFVSAGPIR